MKKTGQKLTVVLVCAVVCLCLGCSKEDVTPGSNASLRYSGLESLGEGASSDEFRLALSQAPDWVGYALANNPGLYGYAGDLSQDVFSLGARIPEFSISEVGIKDDDPNSWGYLYPVFCNEEPIACFRVESASVREQREKDFEEKVVSGGGNVIWPMSPGMKECIMSEGACAVVRVSENASELAGTPFAEHGFRNRDWVVGPKWVWRTEEVSKAGAENGDNWLSPFELSVLPQDMKEKIWFSDVERTPFVPKGEDWEVDL